MTARPSLEWCYRPVRSTEGYAPMHDRAIQSVYERVLRPGDIAIDGGAHSGKHTLPMARAVGVEGAVYAFEPLLEARSRLLAAIDAEGLHQITVSDRALSDVPDQEVSFLYFPSRPGISGFLRREGVPELDAESRTAVTTTIDVSVPDVPIRFVKLDVEGAEMLALAGGDATVARSRPIIHVEAGVVSWRPFGYEAADLHFWCALRSYRCFDLVGNDVTSRAMVEASFGSAGVWDYILVPAESDLHDEIADVLEEHRRRFPHESQA